MLSLACLSNRVAYQLSGDDTPGKTQQNCVHCAEVAREPCSNDVVPLASGTSGANEKLRVRGDRVKSAPGSAGRTLGMPSQQAVSASHLLVVTAP